MVSRQRPMGLTIIAAFEIVIGLLFLLGGVSFAALAPYFASYGGLYASVSGIMSGILIVIALITFVIAWGFLKGMGWSRWVGIIFSALGVLSGLVALPSGLLFVVIDGAIIYYLTRPNVIDWFSGKAVSVTPPPPPPPV